MGTRCWSARARLVAGAALIIASASVLAEMPLDQDASPLPCSLASSDENLRCEMKRGQPFTWVGHPPSSLRELYMRLMRQGRLPSNAILALDLKRAPFHPWAGKRSGTIPRFPSVFQLGEEQPFPLTEEEEEEEDEGQEDWTARLDPVAALSSLERTEMASRLVPLPPPPMGHVRVRRSIKEQPHTQVDSYRQESRRPRFLPWGGKRSGMERGKFEDVLHAWATEGDSTAWPASIQMNADMKRKAFSAWAGKRNGDNKRGGFSAWAGKREAFGPWKGKRSEEDEKRQAFSAWAGKRSEDEKRQAFSAWAGKREAFNAWAGKRSSNDNDKRQAFSAWAGKRSNNDDEKRKPFSAWAGKRSDENNDKRQAFNAWAGKRSNSDYDKRQAFSAWAGKRSNNDNKRQGFSAWAGKRSNNEDKRQGFSAWAGKRKFNAWAGKRSDDDYYQEQEEKEEEKSRDQLSSLLQQHHQQEHQQASSLLQHSPDSLTHWDANWDSIPHLPKTTTTTTTTITNKKTCS
ncbi:hypothetical protein O3P69_003550 [Scylla paramamosain]|uniref:Kinin n=1 Tax=Scylla paramamosain TaxID=85552 RepID=A0AAW0ULR0_SCYPA